MIKLGENVSKALENFKRLAELDPYRKSYYEDISKHPTKTIF